MAPASPARPAHPAAKAAPASRSAAATLATKWWWTTRAVRARQQAERLRGQGLAGWAGWAGSIDASVVKAHTAGGWQPAEPAAFLTPARHAGRLRCACSVRCQHLLDGWRLPVLPSWRIQQRRQHQHRGVQLRHCRPSGGGQHMRCVRASRPSGCEGRGGQAGQAGLGALMSRSSRLILLEGGSQLSQQFF